MPGLGSVAGFASDHHVLALLFLLNHVDVASLAHIVTGEGHGSGRDLGNGVTAIVSVLAKTVRDNEGTERDEGNQCNHHDRRKPNEMFNVLKQVVRPTPDASRAIWRDALGYLGIVRRTMIEITGTCDGAHDGVADVRP